ncbi:hypothetical protein KJ765_02190 [Candidatus Micrarchaeota archaeon]|nr:hypothetical protein [Candidatus Micrarchaeota archaeon]
MMGNKLHAVIIISTLFLSGCIETYGVADAIAVWQSDDIPRYVRTTQSMRGMQVRGR